MVKIINGGDGLVICRWGHFIVDTYKRERGKRKLYTKFRTAQRLEVTDGCMEVN